jgi:hypothetical protein
MHHHARTNDWKLDFNLILTVRHNITKPIFMRLDRIDREGGDQTIHCGKFIILGGKFSNLGGTNRCYCLLLVSGRRRKKYVYR